MGPCSHLAGHSRAGWAWLMESCAAMLMYWAWKSLSAATRALLHEPVGCVRPRLRRLAVEGNGFLYKQVRHMAGALLAVGSGRVPSEHIQELLAAGGALILKGVQGLALAYLLRPGCRADPGSTVCGWGLLGERVDCGAALAVPVKAATITELSAMCCSCVGDCACRAGRQLPRVECGGAPGPLPALGGVSAP